MSVAHVQTPVWSTLDAGGMKEFPVLDGIECLVIYADADSAGESAADACAARCEQAGKDVSVVVPIAEGSDVNDLAVGGPR